MASIRRHFGDKVKHIRVASRFTIQIWCISCSVSPWRNWLARSAVNRKVGGSSPPGDVTPCKVHLQSLSVLGRRTVANAVVAYFGDSRLSNYNSSGYVLSTQIC